MAAEEHARPTRPTPARLAGRRDPATTVRPVDYTATGARPAAADRAGRVALPANPDGDATPIGGGAKLPRRRGRTLSLPLAAPSAPQDAVHSLGPEDPHPASRPLQIQEHLIRVVGAENATAEQIVLSVADPEEAWTADVGVSDHFLRGNLVVQVRRRDNAVIGAFSRGYALAVRPEAYRTDVDVAIGSAGRSARRGLGTRHPTTRRELLDRMSAAGFVVSDGSTHGRVTHPDHPGLFVPLASTPSDVRFTRHAVTQLRRVFGIDLRR